MGVTTPEASEAVILRVRVCQFPDEISTVDGRSSIMRIKQAYQNRFANTLLAPLLQVKTLAVKNVLKMIILKS